MVRTQVIWLLTSASVDLDNKCVDKDFLILFLMLLIC